MSTPSPTCPGQRDAEPASAVAQQSFAGRRKGRATTAEVLPGAPSAAAWFLLEGRHCAILPCQEAQPHGREVLGTLALNGRQYLVVALASAPATGALDQLSPRELEIALLVAEGQDAKAIARRLRISFYTVRVHLGRIYCKLGLHKQTELTACIAARYGTLRPPPEVHPAGR